MAIIRTASPVQCPFYRHDECRGKPSVYRVICEGIVEDSTLALNYRNRKDFYTQMETFCCRHFVKCEIYRMLMEKYQDGE